MPDDRGKLKKLHDNLVRDGYALPDYATFEKDMSDSNNLKKLHGTLVNDGYDLPDDVTFRSDMGFGEVKKKGIFSQGAGILSKAGGRSQSQLSGGGLADVGTMAKPLDEEDPLKDLLQRKEREVAPYIYPDQTTGKKTNVNGLQIFQASKALADLNRDVNNSFIGNKEAAQGVLDKELAKRGIVATSVDDYRNHHNPKNLTQKLALQTVEDVNNIETSLKNSNSIEDAAADYFKNRKDQTGRQAKYFDGDVPNIVKGQWVDEFINSPNVVAMAKQNPQLAEQLEGTRSTLYQNYPEYAIKKVRQIIGQAREDAGINSILSNNPSVDKTEEVVQDLLKKGKISKNEYEIWDKDIKPVLGEMHKFGGGSGVIPTSDVVGSLSEGVEGGAEGILQTLKTIGSFSDTEKKNQLTRDAIIKDYSTLGIKPKGEIKNVLTTGAHLTGYLAPMVLGNVAGIPSMATNTLMFMGGNADNAKKMFPGDQTKQDAYTVLTTGADVFLGDLMPGANKVIKKTLSNDIKTIIQDFTEKKITADVAKKTFINRLSGLVKNNAQTSGMLTGFQVAHNVADAAFGGRDLSVEDIANDAAKNAVINFFAATPLSMLHGSGMSKSNGEIVRSAVENPEVEAKIKELGNPEISKNYENAKLAWDEIKDADIQEKAKGQYLVKDLQQKAFEEKATNSQTDLNKNKWEKQAKIAEIEKKKIYDPELSNTKIVQEFYDNDLLGKGSMESLSGVDADGKPTNKFDPSKVGEYIKEVAQRTNNLDSDWKPNKVGDSSEAAKSSYPEAIVEMANKRWAKEIDNAKTKQDAIQKQESNEMDVRQQAGYGEGMGERNPETEITTREKEGEIKGKEEVVIDQVRELPDENTQTETISETASPVLVGGDGKVKYLDNYEVNDVEIPDGIENEPNWQEKLVDKAFKDMGLKPHKKTAGTGTIYYTFKDKNGEDIVVRLGDHSKGRWAGREVEANVVYDKDSTPRDVLDILRDKLPDGKIVKEQSLSKQESGGKAPVTKPEGKSDVEKQKQLEDKVEEINNKRQSLRGEDGTVPADKMNEWNQLGKELNEAKVSAQRGNSSGSILIKKFEDGADKATSDPVILSEKEKSEASDIIEQVIQGSKTVEEAVKKIARLGYIFDVANANLLTKYISDRLNPDAPKVGNNKSSFQDWVNGKQPEGKSDVVVDEDFTAKGGNKAVDEKGEPITVYHGSDATFNEFKKTKSKRQNLMSLVDVESDAHFFSNDKEFAKTFGKNVKEYHVSIKKPAQENHDAVIKAIKETYPDGSFETSNGVVHMSDYEGDSWIKRIADKDGIDWFLLDDNKFINNLKKEGIDGTGVWEDNGSTSYAVFNKSQIKPVEQSLSKQESGGKATENETKQEPTKDIKPEQAEQKPQPEKTIVEDKQGAGKTKQQEIADKVRALKVNLSKLSGGGLQSNPLGLPVAVWNGAMDIVAKTIEVTGNVADAIQKGIKYIQKNHRGQWDKKGFNDQVLKELGVRGITVNGEDLIVKNDAKTEREYAKTVNGWYSDLEQSVLDVKGEQGRGENWIKVLGKSDEAKWTGLNDWLSQQKGKVSKADIQQYLRDNRIEIVEVVKGAVDYNAKNNNLSYTGSDDFVFLKDNGRNTNYEIRKKKAGFYDVYDNGENIGSRPTLDEAKELAEANFNAENGNPQIDKSASVKFDGYQLAGEKENYKEVLVTMPSATKVEMPKPIETYTGSGKYKLVFDNGNQLSGTYTKEEVADVLKRRSEDKTGMYIDRNEQFKSSHFEEPNILVHLRMNTRVDAEGKKVLFLEEVQSDWGQQGKKSGFANTEQISKLRDEETKLRDSVKKNKGKITADTPDDVYNKIRNENKLLEEQIYAIQTKITDLQSKSTPSAPFVTDTNAWTKLALKVALKEAVKQGAEKIGWTTGEQQNDRYDLSKQVDKIDVEKVEEVPNLFFVDIRLPDGTKYMLEIENGVVRSDSKYEGQRLEDIVGKDIAEKILNGGTQTLQGDGLKIGGKGMKGFYGSPTEKSLGIVGNVAKSLFKQEPKTIEIENSNIKKSSIGTGKLFTKNAVENAFTRGMVVKDYNGNILTKEEAIRLAENANSLDDKEYAYATNKESTSTQHSIDITPELKAEVEGGLPLFKDIKGRGKEIADLLRKGKIKLGGLQSNIAGLPIAVYNGAIEVIARALEGGATLTQAINRAYQKLKIKEKHKNFNQDEFIKKLEEATGEKFEDSEGAKESGEKINLTHAGTEEIYKEGGLPLRLETPTKHREQLEKEADEILQKGYDFDKVADETLSGNRKWEDTDQVLFERKVADLKAKQKGLDVLSPEFDKLQTQIEKYSRASDIAGTLGGRLLQSRKAGRDVEETISDYLIVEKELNQDAPLTDKQKETVQKEFTDIQKAQADYNQKIAELQAENARLKAEAEVKKAKATSKKGVKKDYAAERKEIFESIKEKLKKARQDTSATILPYAKELIAIAPEIGKLVKNLVDNGVDKLADIVKEIHSGLKEDIEGITEKDVRDLIAGEYNPKKPTRTELATKLFDLKRQAQLTNKLEALLRGEEPKNEQKKIRRNQGIENLKSQIKEFEKAKKDAEKEPVEKKTPDEIALQAIKTRTQKELDKINEQLRTGDFSKPEKKEATKLDREAIELKDKLIKARQEREIRILKQEYANRSKYEKAKQNALEVLNVPRTIMSSMDYSAPLRQGLWAGISHPRTMGLAGIEMFKQSLSQKRFDRWFHDLRETPRYETMEKSGLYVADPHDPRLSAKEEAFMNNLAEKIPFLGKLIKGSERAYVGFLNKMRVDLFNRFADRYEEQGRTVENSPELYKSMADYINNSTGRGKLGPLENYAPLFNTAFFSPRLMASRINLLTMPFTPKFYSKEVPKQIRIMYAKDLFKFLALGTSVLALAKLNGAQVEDDPRSSDFGKIHDKNTRWDVWGGFQPYVRLAAQMVTGEKKSTNSGEIQNLNGEGRFGTNRMDVFGQFLRGKLSPVPGMAVDFVKGKDAVGNDVTIGGEAESHLLPLLYSDLKEAIKDRGVSALFTVGVPSIFGVGTNTYSPRPPAKPRKQTTGKPQGPKKEKM